MNDTPANALSEVNAKTLGDTFANVEVVALVKRQLATHWVTWWSKALLANWTRH